MDPNRQLHARHWDLAELADRAPARPSGGTPRRLVQVYNGGSMGSSADLFYLTHPAELDGSETEGGTYTQNSQRDADDPGRRALARPVGRRPVDRLRGRRPVGRGARWIERGDYAAVLAVPIPKTNLTLSWTNLLTGPGSTTLTYDASLTKWTATCIDQQSYELLCSGGQIEFIVTFYLSGTCPTGGSNFCSNLRANPFGLTMSSYTCSPFSVTFNTSPKCPDVEAPGYLTFTITL